MKRLLNQAMTEADGLGHHRIRPEHLLLAVLEEPGCSASAIMREVELDREVLVRTATEDARVDEAMERYTYPHIIENGAGERITFLRKVPSDAGDRFELENVVRPGSGPPMHIHHYQDEALTVVYWRIDYQRRGEPPQFAGQGDTVTFKAGEPHKFWNPGEGDLRCRGYVVPADNVEYFLTQLYDSTKRNGKGRPVLVLWSLAVRRE